MTGRISFPMAELEKVVAQFQQEGVTLTATMDCLFDASLYQYNKIVDKNGLTELQAKKTNKPWWPDSEKIDKSKLTPKLMIVGDHGVYVMANVNNPHLVVGGKRQANIIAYGDGCNPNVDEDFYERKTQVFGGDDGAISVGLDWYEKTKAAGKKHMTIQFNKTSIRLIE